MSATTAPTITSASRLRVGGVSKTFGQSKVLNDVELSVAPGEIHGLVGQNGSGKSTLIKILTGIHAPDVGAAYEVDSHPIRLPVRWSQVRTAGVSVVHQDLGLLDEFTVAENICVGGYPTHRRTGRIDRKRCDQLAADTLSRLGCELAPQTLVGTLTATERAEVAIARAMRNHARGSGLIILDESTRALAGEDLRRIHDLLRKLAAEGSSTLLVSHNLSEILQVTDRVTVLRDGNVSGRGLHTADLTEEEIARRMLGSTVERTKVRPTSQTPAAVEALNIRNLAGKRVRDFSLTVRAGEIVGITGLPGNGYEEIPYLLCGATPAASGTLMTPTSTVSLPKADVVACLRAGLVLVPERRDRDGLASELSMRDNISLPLLSRRGRWWLVKRKWQEEQAKSATRTFGIRPRTPSLLVKQLSGGNQQKVLLAKWMSLMPSVLVLHEPTQAVDVGARRDILAALRNAAEDGMAIVLVSAEPEDLAYTCDRVVVYSGEHPSVESTNPTADTIIELIYGAECMVPAAAEKGE